MRLNRNLVWASEIEPNIYLDAFSDSMLMVGSTVWKIWPESEGELIVNLPNNVTVSPFESNFRFDGIEYEQLQSTLLWIHSIGYLPQLFSKEGGMSLISGFLDEYVPFIQSVAWLEVSSQMTSLDHAIAMRIRTTCMLFAQYANIDRDPPEILFELLELDMQWAGIESNYARNNHGMMLATAVLHVAYMFPLFGTSEIEMLAERQLHSIVSDAFDSTWICKENTAGYQAFYVRFCRDILRFITACKRSGNFEQTISAMLQPATKTLQTLVLPNGDFPAMGDSGGGPSGFKSVDGSIFSEESGLYVEKRSGVYRSLKCGFSSYVHKHADDTSLTLSVGGDELLLDGGLHSYDWSDSYTLAVKSQRGHSGVFFPRFDELYSGMLYDPRHNRVASSLSIVDRGTPNEYFVGRCAVNGTHHVKRSVTFGDGAMAVQDFFTCRDQFDDVAVQRFLLPLGAEIAYSQGEIRVTTVEAWMTIQFDPLRKFVVRSGTKGQLPAGWISRQWGIKLPCVAVDILPRDGWSTMDASIKYGMVRHKADNLD
ncbi:heparinase II/III family protein [Arthrobacter sp. TMN-49]